MSCTCRFLGAWYTYHFRRCLPHPGAISCTNRILSCSWYNGSHDLFRHPFLLTFLQRHVCYFIIYLFSTTWIKTAAYARTLKIMNTFSHTIWTIRNEHLKPLLTNFVFNDVQSVNNVFKCVNDCAHWTLSQCPHFVTSPSFINIETIVSYWISRLYLTGVTAASLRRRLLNVSVIWRIQHITLWNENQ